MLHFWKKTTNKLKLLCKLLLICDVISDIISTIMIYCNRPIDKQDTYHKLHNYVNWAYIIPKITHSNKYKHLCKLLLIMSSK